MTATLKVGGLPPSCPVVFSETTCADPPPQPVKLIVITGALNRNESFLIETALKRFQEDKSASAYVVIYTRRRDDFRKRERAVKKLFGSGSDRLVFLDSRSQQQRIVIWSVPAGATPPVP